MWIWDWLEIFLCFILSSYFVEKIIFLTIAYKLISHYFGNRRLQLKKKIMIKLEKNKTITVLWIVIVFYLAVI